ncbi:hypothetical protein [Roseibium sp. Sym1]|uniref:hypothetical protein n=1 Tax=Roseibium sp. Sym1 TaxID=3016006 RepID=UPI0022B45DCD|nr:hypothetical protein [Roseibium sp. Sym1]
MSDDSDELAEKVLQEMGQRLMLGGEALTSLKGLWATVRTHEIATGQRVVIYPPQRCNLERLTGIPQEEK